MARSKEFPSDPLERSQQRWVDLFFGVWVAIGRRDPGLVLGLMLALQKAGLTDYQGDALTFIPELFALNPSDAILKKTGPFRRSASIPSLRGRVKGGRTQPPYFSILTQYYRTLLEEKSKVCRGRKLKGAESPHERAIQLCAKGFKYSTAAFRKHLEQAQKRYPQLTSLWKGKGAEWIEFK